MLLLKLVLFLFHAVFLPYLVEQLLPLCCVGVSPVFIWVVSIFWVFVLIFLDFSSVHLFPLFFLLSCCSLLSYTSRSKGQFLLLTTLMASDVVHGSVVLLHMEPRLSPASSAVVGAGGCCCTHLMPLSCEAILGGWHLFTYRIKGYVQTPFCLDLVWF